MPAKKISELDELAEAPAADDLLAIVDVSDTSPATPSGKTKRIRASNLVVPSLTYPTAHHKVEVANFAPGSRLVQLGDGTLTDPEGWQDGANAWFLIPDGIFALVWYWETSSGNADEWDNYIATAGAGPDLAYGIYPTAPPAHLGSHWGSGSATLKFYDEAGGGNYVYMIAYNRSAGNLPFRSWFSMTRLDA